MRRVIVVTARSMYGPFDKDSELDRRAIKSTIATLETANKSEPGSYTHRVIELDSMTWKRS